MMLTKKIFVLLFLITAVLGEMRGQSVAQNWSKNDCSGKSYTLYDYLDSNQVAIMEFSMGCSSCTDASKILQRIKYQFDISNPGKVKQFYLDYDANNTCGTITSALLTNSVTCPGFSHCLGEKSYYTSASPMPMIVIAGGCNHTVFYRRISFADGDTTAIKDSINYALNNLCVSAIASIKAEAASVSIFPNPAKELVNFEMNGFDLSEPVRVKICDLSGKIICSDLSFTKDLVLNISEWSTGFYFLTLSQQQKIIHKKFVVGF